MARHEVSYFHTFTELVSALEMPVPGYLRYGTYRNDSLFGGAGGDTLEGFGGSDMVWMLMFTAVLFPMMRTRAEISRLEGGMLIASYGTYLTLLVLGR